MVLPSLNLPVAVNLINVCRWIVGFAGVMVMLTRSTDDTVRPVDPLMEPTVAVMVVFPAAMPVARP